MANCNSLVRTVQTVGVLLGVLLGCRRRMAVVVPRAVAVAGCDSPYLPVHEGARWTYDVRYEGMPTPNDAGTVDGRFSQAITRVHPGGFEMEQRWPYVTQTVPWACRADGLVPLQRGGPATQSSLEGNGTMTFTTESVEGVAIPIPWPSLGGSWNVLYRVRGEARSPTGAQVVSRSVYASTFTVAAYESVVVAGRTYDTVRLRVTNTIHTDVTASDRPGRSTSTLTEEGSSWYAAGVGWVRSALTTHGPRGEPVQSVTELYRFAPGE